MEMITERVRSADHAPAASYELPRGTLLRIEDPRGCRIECLTGCLWVTQDGDPRDIMLEPGEHLRLAGTARVLVQAMRAARLTLHRRAQAGPATAGLLPASPVEGWDGVSLSRR